MNASAALIAQVRAAGVSLHRVGKRLIVEAPPGVITSEIRGELAQSKMEVLAALDQESLAAAGRDHEVREALGKITGLLATAYRRYAAIQRVGRDRKEGSGDVGLANSGTPSVHGGVS